MGCLDIKMVCGVVVNVFLSRRRTRSYEGV